VGKPEGRRPLGRPSVDGRIILTWITRYIKDPTNAQLY
jgi:hypothetical protein